MSSDSRPMGSSSGNQRKPTYDMFVANFPQTATDIVIRESFAKFGPIAAVHMREGKSPGNKFAFVKFLCQQSVDLALAETVYIDSHKIRCGRANRSFDQNRVSSESNSDAGSLGGYNNHRLNQVPAASGNKPDIGLSQHSNQNFPPSQGNKQMQLFMTHVDSPCVFWAQKPELAEVIMNVERSLASVCPMASRLNKKPEPNKIYGTQFSFDEQWYRCELHRYVSESQSEVVYSDYGNKEIVYDDKIVELPECLMQLNPLAQKYCLYGIQAVDDPVLFAKGVDKLSLLKERSVLNAMLYEPFNGITPVKMKTIDGFDVIKEMLNSKTCIPLNDLNTCQINLKDQTPEVDGILSPTPLKMVQGDSKVRKISDGSGDSVGTGLVDKLEKEVKQLNHEKTSLEKRVQVLHREVEDQRHDFEARREQELKRNFELNEELRRLQNQKQALEVELSAALNNTFSNKVARVFTGLQKLMLKREQLQSAAGISDPIDEAIAMTAGSTKQTSLDMVPVLQQIDEIRSSYEALQQKLRMASEDAQCHNSAEIDQTILDRNEARRKLFQLLQEFINLFSDVDALTSREAQIEKLLTTLQKPCQEFPWPTDVDLGSLSEAYLAWKGEKQQKLEDIRTATDSLGSLVSRSLGELQKELLHRSSTVDLTEVSVPDFDVDRLFEDYGSAIDTEMKLANQVTAWKADCNQLFNLDEESADDILIIKRTQISLASELSRKLENVRKLISFRARFLDECEDLDQWLSKSPDITLLQATAKTIKTLKSKLRYRLADLQDLQEDGQENSEEFRSVESDLAEIRDQLHQQLEIEDKQLEWLSDLTRDYFPEMIIKHPEFNLQKFIKFNGLLKSGRMLDLFQLKPLPGCTKKTVYKSTYCGKPVILKEFFIGMQSDASETHFLDSVKEYCTVMHPPMTRLMAVFFGMNDRQAVVVLPCYEFNLTQLIEDDASGLVPDKVKVLGSIICGIDILHRMELVHGAIHPNNVLVSPSSGEVVVADYDFTKTPSQRAENPFTTSSGLRFQAPELQLSLAHSGFRYQGPESRLSLADCKPTCQSDMYNLGLLILWIHDPQIASVPSSLLDLSSTSLDSDTATLVAVLLEKYPERRPGTDKILEAGYFAPCEPEEESCAANTKEEASLPSEADDTSSSADVPGMETEVQLVEGIVKDATEECEVEEEGSTEEQRLPESVEEHDTQSKENKGITEYDSKQDTGCAECKTGDIVSEDSCKDV